jgi:hypothetical protein
MPLLTLMTVAGVLASASPSTPAPSEHVVIRYKTRETLDGAYHVEARHRLKDPACADRSSRRIRAGRADRVVRLAVRPPEAGWCAGTYKATVYFKQTVHCPPTINCGDSAERPIGSTTFTVRPS